MRLLWEMTRAWASPRLARDAVEAIARTHVRTSTQSRPDTRRRPDGTTHADRIIKGSISTVQLCLLVHLERSQHTPLTEYALFLETQRAISSHMVSRVLYNTAFYRGPLKYPPHLECTSKSSLPALTRIEACSAHCRTTCSLVGSEWDC